MIQALPNRAVTVWAVLVLATFATAWLGTDHGIGDVQVQTTVVLAIAAIKARLVGLYFMGIREAPQSLRLVFEGWCAFLLVGTVGLYLFL